MNAIASTRPVVSMGKLKACCPGVCQCFNQGGLGSIKPGMTPDSRNKYTKAAHSRDRRVCAAPFPGANIHFEGAEEAEECSGHMCSKMVNLNGHPVIIVLYSKSLRVSYASSDREALT